VLGREWADFQARSRNAAAISGRPKWRGDVHAPAVRAPAFLSDV